MTIAYHTNFKRQSINNMQNPCAEINNTDMPFEINLDTAWGVAKLYFTENAVGKVLTGFAFVALNNVVKKTCELQINFQETYSQVDQL